MTIVIIITYIIIISLIIKSKMIPLKVQKD